MSKMLTPDQIDDLADAVDAKCFELGPDAGAWMFGAFLEALKLTPEAPDWFSTCVAALCEDTSLVTAVHQFATNAVVLLEDGDAQRALTSVVGHHPVTVHPYLVLGLERANHELLMAAALRSATRDGNTGRRSWDSTQELYRLLCEVPTMAEQLLHALRRAS